MPTDKTPPLHPKPHRGLKSKFMPVNDEGTVPQAQAAATPETPVRRAGSIGKNKSGGMGPKQ